MTHTKYILTLLLLICTILFVTSCGSKDDLIGKWKRNDTSPYSGLVVEVRKIDKGYIGIIIEMPEYMKDLGFKIDDTKWDNIAKEDDNLYSLSDLGKSGSNVLWYDMYMEMSENSSYMKLRDKASQNELGDSQIYIKIE